MDNNTAHANIQAWARVQTWDFMVPVPSGIDPVSGVVVAYGWIGQQGSTVWLYQGDHMPYGQAVNVHVHDDAATARQCANDTAEQALRLAAMVHAMAPAPVPDTVPQGWDSV